MNLDLAQAFVARSRHQIAHARDKIDHCFDQLHTEDVWWTPGAGRQAGVGCNSIGVIIQHLMGNLRQWALSGVGGAADVRDRPSEFRAERETPKSELHAAFNDVLVQAADRYAKVSASELLARRRIQGFDTTVLDAMYDTMCHLELHTGQVLYLTRLRLGAAYRESWQPASSEQGA